MTAHTVLAAIAVSAISLGASGALLLRTRARLAGALMLLTAVGTLASALASLAGSGPLGRILLIGSLELAGGLAVLAYPRPRFEHPVDFCAWIVVAVAGVAGTAGAANVTVYSCMGVTIALTLTGQLWWRFESSGEPDRQAVLWFTITTTSTGLILGIAALAAGEAGKVIGVLLLAAVGPAMVIGVRRPAIADVRAVIVGVTVLGVVAISYVSVFVGLLAGLDLVGQHHPSQGLLAVVGVLVAAGFHPLRVVLRGVVDELLFGDRPSPLDAATRVADRIGDDPVFAMRAIREALVLPYASLSAGGVELAASGTAVTYTRRLPLSLGADTVGEIVVGLRPGDLSLSTGDEQVLRIVAPLLAQTLRARALADDLRESRGAAIAAIEEERRRLRRDLHDGLGPTLSGIGFTADAARNTIRSDPRSADDLLRRLRADAVAAVGEIRRLVYDMRPPALDELGLVSALRQQTSRIRTAAGDPMRVSVDAPADLPRLPAAVEVAAYRIATEAVTNSARHSGADVASVCIDVEDDSLAVTIRDPSPRVRAWVPGVGMSSMRERAAEVGGTLFISGDEQGSLVRAHLPIG